MTSKNQRRISFSLPLIGFTVAILLFASSLQAVYLVNMIRIELRSVQEENFSLITESFSNMMELELEGNEHQLQGFASAVSMLDGSSGNISYEKILNEVGKSNRYYETVFICDIDGVITHSPTKSIIGADISAREYFRAVVNEGKATYTTRSALVSKATGNVTVVHAARIEHNGRTVGLLGASLNLSLFGDELILSKRFGESGYPYVMDSNGLILIHPSEDLLYTSSLDLGPVFHDVVNSSEYRMYLGYELFGTRKQGIFVRMPGREWIIGMAIDYREAFALVDSIRLRFILSGTAMILITGAFIFFYIKKRLVFKIGKLGELMDMTSRGILSERGNEKGRDEIAGMTSNLNTLLDSFNSFFGSLFENMQNLEDVGIDLSSNMEETTTAAYQIQTNVENSLIQIERQEQGVSMATATIKEMAQNIKSLDGNIEFQNENIAQGSAAVEEMVTQIRAVSTSTEEAEKIMEALSLSSRKGQENMASAASMIGSIASQSRELEQANALISEIAGKTNLLAMNAAIEAAHAGNAGRGFAVVADEIRKLAEQSSMHSSQVKKTISGINAGIDNLVGGSEESRVSFQEILADIERMRQVSSEIKGSMEEQVAGSSQILESLNQLRNAGEEVGIGSAEMAQGSKDILNSAIELSHITNAVSGAFSEISSGITEINKAIKAVRDLALTNRSSIEAVRTEAEYYKL